VLPARVPGRSRGVVAVTLTLVQARAVGCADLFPRQRRPADRDRAAHGARGASRNPHPPVSFVLRARVGL